MPQSTVFNTSKIWDTNRLPHRSLFSSNCCNLFAENFIFFAVKNKSDSENRIEHGVEKHPDIVYRVFVKDVQVEWKHFNVFELSMIENLPEAVFGKCIEMVEILGQRFRTGDRVGTIEGVHKERPAFFEILPAQIKEDENLVPGEMIDLLFREN